MMPSRALLAAAVGGLLGACSTSSSRSALNDFGDGALACGDAGNDAAVLSSHQDPTMTLDTFKSLCTQRSGTVEIHAHCGGMNSCKGMSYDSGTQTLTEHSCKGANTCTGFSCVLKC